MNRKYSLILALLMTLVIANLFFILKPENYILSSFAVKEKRTIVVERVIDGDTFVTRDGETIRLLNINTPEKKHAGYEEASNYLKSFENQTLEIEDAGKEKYGRTLARIYFNDEYLNLKIIENGLGNKFLVNAEETKKFYDAEESAMKNFRGMWEKSEEYKCLGAKVDAKKEVVKLSSTCGKINVKNWVIKDESRKEYKFQDIDFLGINLHSGLGDDNETDIYWQNKEDIWNNDRDTIYIFDSESKMVGHEAYGY